MNFLTSNVRWGRRNFLPAETHPMGGFGFQAALLLITLFVVTTGNRGVTNTRTLATS